LLKINSKAATFSLLYRWRGCETMSFT